VFRNPSLYGASCKGDRDKKLFFLFCVTGLLFIAFTSLHITKDPVSPTPFFILVFNRNKILLTQYFIFSIVNPLTIFFLHIDNHLITQLNFYVITLFLFAVVSPSCLPLYQDKNMTMARHRHVQSSYSNQRHYKIIIIGKKVCIAVLVVERACVNVRR